MSEAGVSGIPRRFDPQLAAAILAGATLLVSQAMVWFLPEGQRLEAVALTLVWISLIAGGIYGVQAAWDAIKQFSLDIDILMVVGAALSAYIGHPQEGALLLFMFTLAGALEHRSLAKAKDAVARLTKLMPHTALRRSGEGAWEACSPDVLKAGDVILIKPGETVPADAVVTLGRSELDTSTLTGESLPRSVGEGDEVFAGTVNQSGSLEARVSRPVAESSLNRVLALVIEAQERKQRVQRLIDRLSTPYTTMVFALSLAALAWYRLWQGEAWDDAAYHAITLLIVCSPCALVIATPTATLCGLSRAARSGLLVKGGDALERLATVRTVALDKTGTITLGKISVVAVHAVGFGAAASRDGSTESGSDLWPEMLALVTGIEGHSTHPIAGAIVAWAGAQGVQRTEPSDVRNVPGQGLEADSKIGPIRVGRLEWAAELLAPSLRAEAEKAVADARAAGYLTAVGAARDGAVVVSLADTPRPGAPGLMRGLKDAGIKRVAMLTGDHKIIAEKMAGELGIPMVYAQLLPEQKVERLRELKSLPDAGGLALVGDGVNDAPGLALADVGLAMGGIGAGAALEAADVVVLTDDLNRIPWAFALARRVRRVMVINLAFAVGVIAVLGVLAALKLVPLGAGVVGHEGSTLVVVGISLTILGLKGPGDHRVEHP